MISQTCFSVFLSLPRIHLSQLSSRPFISVDVFVRLQCRPMTVKAKKKGKKKRATRRFSDAALSAKKCSRARMALRRACSSVLVFADGSGVVLGKRVAMGYRTNLDDLFKANSIPLVSYCKTPHPISSFFFY